MYSVNDTVVYASHGVCVICGICEKEFMGESADYYVLKPVYENKSTVFVPVGNPAADAKMKPVLTREEILGIIGEMPGENAIWIENEAERRRRYTEILRDGNRKEIICMLKALYIHKQETESAGRKFHAADERMLKEGERLLYDEFSHVLDIKREDVLTFIMDMINTPEL